jgi:hypothetical protein
MSEWHVEVEMSEWCVEGVRETWCVGCEFSQLRVSSMCEVDVNVGEMLHDCAAAFRAPSLWIVWVFFAIDLSPDGWHHVVARLVAIVD